MKILLLLLVFLVSCSAQVQDVELFSADNSLPMLGSVQGLYANLNCSTFMNSRIRINSNLPNFQNTLGQAIMYVGLQPATSGRYAPFPDPADASTFRYTTLLPNFTIASSVAFTNTGSSLYITMYCSTSVCEYNVVIGQADFNSVLSEPAHKSAITQVKVDSKKAMAIEIKRLMMRNKITLNGVVNYNQWNTVMLPVCGQTLSGIYGPTATVCLEATVVGTKLGYLFYQQISTYNNQNPNIPMWYRRQPDTQEPIRDLTGTEKLPVNRYRTTPISIPALEQVTYVYHSIVGEGGEGTVSPYPNFYTAWYEWFTCDS